MIDTGVSVYAGLKEYSIEENIKYLRLAKELGCKYIGFELNPTFYEIALDRLNGIDQNGQIDLLAQDYEQLDLFGEENYEQKEM